MSHIKMEGIKGRVRFSQAPWFSSVHNTTVTVIGAGGIGSWLAHFLARMGVNVILWDGDAYNINNMGGQLASIDAVGVNKAIATAALINTLLGEERIFPRDRMYSDKEPPAPIMFLCVDSMDARKVVYDKWKGSEKRNLLIDGRMGAEQFELYTATGTRDTYMDHWFPPHEATPLPCAYRATSHIGSMLASLMAGLYTNHHCGEYVPAVTTYNMQLLMLESNHGKENL